VFLIQISQVFSIFSPIFYIFSKRNFNFSISGQIVKKNKKHKKKIFKKKILVQNRKISLSIHLFPATL
jgi:hypothetical protein